MEDFASKSDQELVIMALNKADDFLYLMKRYEAKLLSYIRRLSNLPVEDAQDILQEVFIKVYKNLRGYDSGLKFSSWIYRITHNEVISRFRKNQARPQTVSWDLDEGLLNKLSTDMQIEKMIDQQFLQENFSVALNDLDDKYRQVLILKFYEDKDYTEISDILKKPSGTIATLINRGKKHLKDKLLNSNLKYDR